MNETLELKTKSVAGASGAEVLPVVFHADLSDAHPGEEYYLAIGGKRIPMLAHTEETRASALRASPELASRRKLTHYSGRAVALPSHSVVRIHLKHTMRNFKGAKALEGVGHCALYIPPPAAKRKALLAANGTHHVGPIDYVSTAQTFLFHHPDIINNDPEVTGIIMDRYMQGDKATEMEVNNLAMLMRQMGPSTETSGWARLVPFTPDNGDRFDGSKTYYQQQPTDEVQAAALPALSRLLVQTKNDPDLKGKKWNVQEGQSVERQDGAAQLRLAAARPRAPARLGDEHWSAAVAVNAPVHGLQTSISIVDATKQKIRISLRNTYIRYVCAYIQFYDANGNAMSVPDWQPDDGGASYSALTGMDLQYDDVRILGLIAPINSVLGIPIYADPGALDVTVTFPKGAVSASVYGSGIGTGDDPWPKTPALGGVMTGVFNLGVPAFMLGFAVAAQTYKPLYDIAATLGKDPRFIIAIIAAGAAYFGGTSAAQKGVNYSALSQLSQFLFSKAATKALVWVESTLAEGEAEDQIPFAGWIMIAINIATGVAQMAQTIVEVSTSPWNIENRIATTITTSVTVRPDPRHKVFPQGAAGAKRTCTVKMIYQDQKRPAVSQDHDVAAGSSPATIAAAFPGNTLGGQVKFEADFYIGTWLAGKATTGWIANDDQHVAAIDMALVEFPVPLDEKSVYTHARMLTYANGAYGWTDSATPPTATITSRSASPSGNALADWTGISLSQRTGMIGFAWEAAGMGVVDCDTGASGQLYAFMNANIPGLPMNAVKFPTCGFTGPTRLVYDPYPPKFKMDASGQWVLQNGLPVPDPAAVQLGEYYVDPRPAGLPYENGGGFHLRKVTLDDATPFNMAKGQPSYGRFAYFPDSIAMHPSGMVIGVNAQFAKLQVMRLSKLPRQDAQVPLARIGAGPATDRTRPGLLFRPAGVTCTYDGTIIVLEDTKSSTGGPTDDTVSRLSAYDLHMNPVSRFFDANGQPSPWLYLSNAADFHYLDLASVGDEKLTYLYVLYYTGAGASPADYHMAIYTYGPTPPAKNPLVTTDGIAAARLAVDMWHSAYTLNFGMVTDGKGKPSGPQGTGTGPAGRTVPSISMWVPPLPKS